MNRISPLKGVWLKNPDGTKTAARIETRRGGVYQIEVHGETRRVLRSQIVRMTHVRS